MCTLSLEIVNSDLAIFFYVGYDDFKTIFVAPVSCQSLEFIILVFFIEHRENMERQPVVNQNFLLEAEGTPVHEVMLMSILPVNMEHDSFDTCVF